MIKHFNLIPGERSPHARIFTVNEDSIGPHDRRRKVKPGDTMIREFLDTNLPPKCNENSPKYDSINCLKLHDRGMKYLRAEIKEIRMST